MPFEPISRDPVEQTAEYRRVIATASRLANQHLRERGIPAGVFGSCHFFWDELQHVLRTRYGVSWRTPDELNPATSFD